MRSVLFDLDGTLTNPRQGIVGCFVKTLSELGLPVPVERELEKLIGPPFREAFGKLLGPAHIHRLEESVALYRKYYAEHGMYENEVYDGIPDLLALLKEDGVKLFVATSKPWKFAVPILEHFKLDRHFTGVYGAELDGTRSVKGDLIQHLTSQERIDPAHAVMIGDREHDVIGARRNGIPTIGVLYGFGSREELESAGAHAICEKPADIPQYLK